MQVTAQILVVEDDAHMRGALLDKLVNEGFGIVEAADGKQGLELALAEHPDLILLDIAMPVMDGEKMLEKLRADSWGSAVPVILLTNMSYLQDKDSKQRTDEYLLKSDTNLEDLVEKIRGHLEKSDT